MQGEFGDRLKYFRERKEVSIEKLAIDTGISAALLCSIEAGVKKQRFSYPVLLSIADALGIAVEELVEVK